MLERSLTSRFTILAIVAISSLFWKTPYSQASCPSQELRETPADCPWAELTRDIAPLKSAEQIAELLKKKSPQFFEQICTKPETPAVLAAWGRSNNFDELAKATIVQPELLDALLACTGAPAREDRVVHAGVEHTYGYLLSNLLTPYGYKRARWVQPDLEQGLGLPAGTLSPTPATGKQGTFLSNITFLATRLAFQNSPTGIQPTNSALSTLSPETFKRDRLIETFKPSAEKTIRLYTDFIAFKNPVSGSSNTYLLIYSYTENENPQKLITLFPVSSDFKDRVFNPSQLGSDKTILTRYNAFIPETSGSPWVGERKMESPSK